MKNIIFIAPPAAGKGTHSALLKEKFGYAHLSTGDMLREAIASGSKLGLVVKDIIDKGNLVSDDIMIELIKDKLTELSGKPFILDGFPRTLNQAKCLDEIIDSDYRVICLDLQKEEALKRIDGRRACSGCNKGYNVAFADLTPKVDGICDDCGAPLIKRADDNAEAYEVRYDNYLKNTEPVLNYYEEKGLLRKIDVSRDIDVVASDVAKVVTDD